MARIETIVCDACGAELPIEPLLRVAIEEPSSSFSHRSELCDPCFGAVWNVLDAQGKRREKPWVVWRRLSTRRLVANSGLLVEFPERRRETPGNG